MSDIPAIQRQLKIKSGSVKRLSKEHQLYRAEAETNKIKLDKLKEEATVEAWDIKNATKLLEESNKMIDDSAERLANVVAELRDLVIKAKSRSELAEDVELLNAESVLEEISV